MIFLVVALIPRIIYPFPTTFLVTISRYHFFNELLSLWTFLFVSRLLMNVSASQWTFLLVVPLFVDFSPFPNYFLAVIVHPLSELQWPFNLVTSSSALSSTDLHDGGDDDLIGTSMLSHVPFLWALNNIWVPNCFGAWRSMHPYFCPSFSVAWFMI